MIRFLLPVCSNATCCLNESSRSHAFSRILGGEGKRRRSQIVVPRRISADTNGGGFHHFLSFAQQSGDEEMRYNLTAFGKVYKFVLRPKRNFISPSFNVEHYTTANLTKPIPTGVDLSHCFYRGTICNDTTSSAAFDLCGGMVSNVCLLSSVLPRKVLFTWCPNAMFSLSVFISRLMLFVFNFEFLINRSSHYCSYLSFPVHVKIAYFALITRRNMANVKFRITCVSCVELYVGLLKVFVLLIWRCKYSANVKYHEIMVALDAKIHWIGRLQVV